MPNKLGIKGEQNFEGKIIHSAKWDHGVTLKDKRVVVIGNGCKLNVIVSLDQLNSKALPLKSYLPSSTRYTL